MGKGGVSGTREENGSVMLEVCALGGGYLLRTPSSWTTLSTSTPGKLRRQRGEERVARKALIVYLYLDTRMRG